MDVCLINNHLPDFSFMSFSATLQLGLHDCHNSTRKCWNKLKTLHTVQSLVWQWNARENQNFTAIAASSCALAVMLAMATKVTQISLMVSVALGKHQIAQQLLGHHCSVRSEKQTAMAENSFDWCWCARCTKNAFAFQKWLQACKLFVIPHKVAKYSSLSSIKYQLDECKIWGNDSRQRNVDYL